MDEEDECKNFMWEHMKTKHPEYIDRENPGNTKVPMEMFEFIITGKFRDPLTRQITEKVRIDMALNRGKIDGGRGKKDILIVGECLNSKEETFAPVDKKWGKKSWKRTRPRQ